MLKIKNYQDVYYDLFMTLVKVGQFTKTIEISKLIEKMQDYEKEVQDNIKFRIKENKDAINRILDLCNNDVSLMNKKQFGDYQYLLGKITMLEDS